MAKVGDTLTAIVEPADAKVTYQWYADATAISGATASTYVVTAADLGKNIKVVVTNENQVKAESEPTADVEEAALTIKDVDQLSANKIAITFASDVDDIVNKDNIKVERVDGLAVIPVNALEWSEDGTVATATLASSLVDKIEYQVSYATGNSVAFTASVGKVSSIEILTATAEQNVTTDVKFALFDENGVDVTSNVNIDTDCDVEIEGVDGAIVTANTSKPSAATVQMTTVNDKAKVTVTYRPNEDLAPATGTILCTATQATIGTARFKVQSSGLKLWDDGTYCAKFYTGSDSTVVGVALGDINDDVYFCVEDKDKPGTVISYDTYEVSSSNDDVMSANIEDNLDTGKYCRISVSGNTIGTANILVKATKNGADYTYTVPVKVVAEKKLTGITVSASRPSMSNAIDTDYDGTLTVTGKFSDGTTATITDYTSEVADAEKNNKLSNNLLKVNDEDQDTHPTTTARGALPFTVDYNTYHAWGAQGKTYTINVATTNDDGKEVKASTSVKVSDLSEAAWKLDGDGAAMEYSIELSNGNTLNETTKTATVARLAAYANKLFAGYVRQDSTGAVAIGTGAGYDGEGTKAVVYGNAPDLATIYKIEAKNAGSSVLTSLTVNATAVRAEDAVAGVAGTGHLWAEVEDVTAGGNTDEGAWYQMTDGKITVGGVESTTAFTENSYNKVETSNGSGEYYYTKDDAFNNAHWVFASDKDTQVTPDFEATGWAAGTVFYDNDKAVVKSTGDTYSVDDDGVYTKDTDASYTSDHYMLVAVANGDTIATPEATERGTAAVAEVPQAVTSYTTEGALTLKVFADATADEIAELITSDTLTKSLLTAEEADEIPVGFTAGTVVPGTDPVSGAGQAKATTKTTISDIYTAVKAGHLYSENGLLFASSVNVCTEKDDLNATDNAGTEILVATVGGIEGQPLEYLVGNTKYDWNFAKPGTYTPTFFFTMDGKDKTASTSVTVTNALVAPKVTVNKRVLDSLTADDVKDAITINCDMNNNTSTAASFNGEVFKNDADTIITDSDPDSDKWTATYVGVNDQGVKFIVPINATFKTE